MHIQYANVDMI